MLFQRWFWKDKGTEHQHNSQRPDSRGNLILEHQGFPLDFCEYVHMFVFCVCTRVMVHRGTHAWPDVSFLIIYPPCFLIRLLIGLAFVEHVILVGQQVPGIFRPPGLVSPFYMDAGDVNSGRHA